MVGINGQVAGLIHFRRSDRLEAAATLRRLRSKRNLQVGIISEQSQSQRGGIDERRWAPIFMSTACQRTIVFAFSGTAATVASRSPTSVIAKSILA